MPLSSPVAAVDRRVTLLHGDASGRPPTERISQLAAFPYVVLLSEPGMGKSTVLKQQASAAGGCLFDVRWFIEGPPVAAGIPLFLDSLDEYRSDSTSAVEKLAARLLTSDAPSWWLSCRAVDWRASDLAVLKRATGGAEIMVAALMPLEAEEADQIIAALTCQNSAGARERAHALGARAFLQNPLSLKLLVSTGLVMGPQSRFELFDGATLQLAHELDERRPANPGRSPPVILATASRLCALLLLANRAAIWHLNRPAPRHGNDERYLAANTLRVPSQLVGQTLDSPLFRRNGEGAFTPMHRAIAEFLAGRALADAVAGAAGQPRLPLGRILALMTAGGRPPTDLRGAYAWTAVHLSRRGCHHEALGLIQQDPVSVLVYGDAAVLTPEERKELWRRLDQDDPWFLANQDGDTAIGGLAGSDLASEFEQVLREPDGVTHRFFAVAEALRYGQPVPELRPLLYDIALDGRRADHERLRASEAWLAGELDAGGARLAMFRACSALTCCDSHTLFRLRMAAELPSDALSDAELDQLLVDYARSKEGAVSGRLWTLSRKLLQNNRPALLDRDWSSVLEREGFRGPTHEIRRVLDQILTSALVASPAPDGETVRNWLANLRHYPTQPVPGALREALQRWLKSDPRHALELLAAIAQAQKARTTSWAVSEYWARCGVLPPVEVAIALLEPDSSICGQLGASCQVMAVDLAMQSGANPAIRPAVITRLKLLPRTTEVDAALDLLENGRPKDPALIEFEKRDAAYRAEQDRRARKVIAKFERSVGPLTDGSALALLHLAAQYRFGTDLHGSTIEPDFDRVIELVGDEVARAIEAGWIRAAKTIKLDPMELGQLEATLQTQPVELLVLAGIDRVLATDPAATRELPLSAALVALKSSHAWTGNDRPAAERISRWALERLVGAGAAGGAALSAFWLAALRHGTKSVLSASWLLTEGPDQGRFAVCALQDALGKYPDMHGNVLAGLLQAAASLLPNAELLALADAALRMRKVGGESRELWLCEAFALNPTAHRKRFGATFAGRADELSEHFNLVGRIAEGFAAQRILIAKGILEVCARGRHRDPFGGGQVARAGLDWLQNSADPLARIALEQLATDATLQQTWRDNFRHALAVQARQLRDRAFAPPAPAAIEEAMSGGAPVNAADLLAVVVEQLRLIQAEMQTGPLDSWDSYWNEKPRTPKTENRCRNALARELQARLGYFGIEIPLLPEAQRAAETRADLLVTSNEGKNLPIEAKRHWHPEVWKAAKTQLQGYASDVGADRYGIYLVFWFGAKCKAVPARRDRRKPTTAEQMEEMLLADLPEHLKARTAIVVLDVSNPRLTKGATTKKRSRRRSL